MEQEIVSIGPQSNEAAVDLEAVFLRRLFDFVAHARTRLFAGSRVQQIEAELNVLQVPALRNLSSPLVRLRLLLTRLVEQRMYTVLEPVVVVLIQIAVIRRRDCIAALENLFDRPAAGG